jgi:hypothetical protein
VTLLLIGGENRGFRAALHHVCNLPGEVERVHHTNIHALPGFGGVGMARITCSYIRHSSF